MENPGLIVHGNVQGGAIAVGSHSTANNFAAAADAIPTGEVFGMAGLARLPGDSDALILQLHSPALFQKRDQAGLP